MELIKKALNKIVNEGYNIVVRSMAERGGISATEAFFVKVAAIRDIMKNAPDLDEFPAPIWFCEWYFHDKIFSHIIPKTYGIYYDHSNGDFTELGFYHYPSVDQDIRPYWDQLNHDELFTQASYIQKKEE